MVKLVPPVRALMLYTRPVVVLHGIPSLVPRDESSVIKIWLVAVTAVVFPTIVLPPVGIATLPAGAEPHTLGEVVELQLEIVFRFATFTCPDSVVVAPV